MGDGRHGRHRRVIAMCIRGGRATAVGAGLQGRGLEAMMARFAAWLSDMDLTFNALDEPRAVVPSGDLERLVKKGDEAIVRAAAGGKGGWGWGLGLVGMRRCKGRKGETPSPHRLLISLVSSMMRMEGHSVSGHRDWLLSTGFRTSQHGRC